MTVDPRLVPIGVTPHEKVTIPTTFVIVPSLAGDGSSYLGFTPIDATGRE
jgi:hypothetical protein